MSSEVMLIALSEYISYRSVFDIVLAAHDGHRAGDAENDVAGEASVDAARGGVAWRARHFHIEPLLRWR